jgi:hypothetical protein
MGFLGGCASIDEPRVVARRVFLDRQLRVTVAPYADRPESHPDIREVEILVDPGLFGAAGEVTEYRVEQSRGKLGPQQTLHFTAPTGASAIHVRLTVRHDGDTFRVTVPFRYRRTPNDDRKRWIRHDEQLRKCLLSP